MKVDVVILAALSDELDAIKEELGRRLENPEHKWRYSGSSKDFDVYDLKNGLRVATAPPMGMGQLAAAVGTSEMMIDLAPSLTLLVGIAGCMEDRDKSESSLGDLVVSDYIIDYELQKLKNGNVEPRWTERQSCRNLLGRIRDNINQ